MDGFSRIILLSDGVMSAGKDGLVVLQGYDGVGNYEERHIN